jgi:hypothetical protein
MCSFKTEVFNFTTIRLIKSNEDILNNHNKGYLNNTNIGFWSILGYNTFTNQIMMCKPKYNHEETEREVVFVDNTALNDTTQTLLVFYLNNN